MSKDDVVIAEKKRLFLIVRRKISGLKTVVPVHRTRKCCHHKKYYCLVCLEIRFELFFDVYDLKC